MKWRPCRLARIMRAVSFKRWIMTQGADGQHLILTTPSGRRFYMRLNPTPAIRRTDGWWQST